MTVSFRITFIFIILLIWVNFFDLLIAVYIFSLLIFSNNYLSLHCFNIGLNILIYYFLTFWQLFIAKYLTSFYTIYSIVIKLSKINSFIFNIFFYLHEIISLWIPLHFIIYKLFFIFMIIDWLLFLFSFFIPQHIITLYELILIELQFELIGLI